MSRISEKQKNLLYFGVATAIIGLLIYLADVNKFLASVSTAKTIPLSISILFGVAVFFIFAFTWHRFLRVTGLDISYIESFRLFMSGQFMNSVTPLGQLGGEPVMAYIIHDNQDISYEKALSAVVSADIVNTIPYFTFLLAGTAYLLAFDSITPTISQAASATVLTAVGGTMIVYALWFRAEKLEKYLNRLFDYLHQKTGWEKFSGLEKSLEEIRETLNRIGENPKHLVYTAAVAHLSFGLQTASLFLILSSINESISLSSIYFVIAVSSLANFSPTPGGSGTFEAAMAGILTELSGLDFADALTVGILYRVATYWSGLLIGYISLASLGKAGNVDQKNVEKKISESS